MKSPRWNTITAEFVVHYSILGAFFAPRIRPFVPYAERVAYAGRGAHHVRVSQRPVAWFLSRLRDIGDALFGSFTAPEEARA